MYTSHLPFGSLPFIVYSLIVFPLSLTVLFVQVFKLLIYCAGGSTPTVTAYTAVLIISVNPAAVQIFFLII